MDLSVVHLLLQQLTSFLSFLKFNIYLQREFLIPQNIYFTIKLDLVCSLTILEIVDIFYPARIFCLGL